MEMLPADGSNHFAAGKVYNLNSSQYICTMEHPTSGAHSDLAHPEVAHAVWEAVRCESYQAQAICMSCATPVGPLFRTGTWL